jgi:ribosome-associated protein
LTPKSIARAAGKLALDKNGLDIKILDLRKFSDVADYFVICTGSVDVHVKAIADNIVDKLKDKEIKVWHKEGYQALNWVLLDYVSVVVHIFRPETRERYALEKLWGDAPIETMK